MTELAHSPEQRDLRPRDWMFMVGLFGAALALRLYASSTLAGEPVWDGHYYEFGARHIASGFGYADESMRGGHPVWHPWCHYPVGYSAFLAAFYKLFGTRYVVAHLANALVGGLLPVVTYLLAREAMTSVRARVAGVLCALHPGLVLYGALVMTEPLSALLVLAAFFTAIRVARTGRPMIGIAAGGFVLGLAVLVRPQALLCAPFLALALPNGRTRRMLSKRILGAVLAGAVTLLTVLPWTARNCRVMDGCALVSTNAGWNLAIGSFPRATGRFETLRSDDGCREVTGQVQQDRCWLEYGLANIRRAPVRWLKLIPAKLAFTFDHESFAVEYLREARPAAWPEDRRVAVRGMLTTVHRILVVASAFGFVAMVLPFGRLWARLRKRTTQPTPARAFVEPLVRRVHGGLLAGLAVATFAAFAADTPTFWPLVLFACAFPWLPLPGRPPAPPALLMAISLLGTTALAHAVFFGEDRYHVVATPVLCLLAAAALRAPSRRTAGAQDGTRGSRPLDPPTQVATSVGGGRPV